MEVLLAQRDLQDSKMVIIDTKKEQLKAVVDSYQALGGGSAAQVFPEANAAEE